MLASVDEGEKTLPHAQHNDGPVELEPPCHHVAVLSAEQEWHLYLRQLGALHIRFFQALTFMPDVECPSFSFFFFTIANPSPYTPWDN